MKKSKISLDKLPSGGSGCCRAIMVDNNDRDRMVTFGFIRKYFGDDLSLDLMELISRFICNEWCHLIQWSTGKHWKIRMADILSVE